MKTRFLFTVTLLLTCLSGFAQSDYVKLFESRQTRDQMGSYKVSLLFLSDVELMALKTPNFQSLPKPGFHVPEDIHYVPVVYNHVKVNQRIESFMFSQYSCNKNIKSAHLVVDVVMCELINRLIKSITR